jgi:ribonuclease P protein component
MLPKNNRLQSKYFKEIYNQGKKYRGEYGMLILRNYSNREDVKLGFVVSKKIGNAVKRHKMTRLLREVARDLICKDSKLRGFKGVYVVFKYCDSYEKLQKEISKHFKNTL